MGIRLTACCAVIAITAGPLCAQEIGQELNTAERRSAVNGALARLSDPTMNAVVGGPAPSLLLEASSTAKIAAGRVGLQAGDLIFDVKVHGAIDSSTKRAILADLDGLRHTSTAEVGVLWTNYPKRVSNAALYNACRKFASSVNLSIEGRECNVPDLRRQEVHAAPPSEEGQPARNRAIEIAHLLPARRLFVAGISYKFGPEDFRYAPTVTADNVGTHRTSWALSAKAGIVLSDTLSLGAMYSHAVAYRAGDTRHICSPVADGVLECADKVVGPPSRLRSELATVEARKLIGNRFAVTPRLVVNVASRNMGIDVPVYFLQSDKGGLAGGITAGWRHSRSSGSTFEVSAFVGQVLGLLLR